MLETEPSGRCGLVAI